MLKRKDPNEYLRNVPLFSGLNKDQLAGVARISDRHQAKAGDRLTEQGRLGHEFVLIVDGKATVSRDGLTLNEIGPGDFFGEMSMIDGGERSAAVTATTDMELIVVDGRAFWPLLETVPGLAHSIMQVLTGRIRELQAASYQH